MIQQNAALLGQAAQQTMAQFGNTIRADETLKLSFFNQINQSVQQLVQDATSMASPSQIVADAKQLASTAQTALAGINGLNVAEQTAAAAAQNGLAVAEQTAAANVLAQLTTLP